MSLIPLDIDLIKDGKPHKLITHFNNLRTDYTEVEICQSLLDNVSKEQVDPGAINPFLPWCQSLESTILWLNYPSSCAIRQFGIKNFGKVLQKADRWADMWESVGGTQGLVDYLAKISVLEVKLVAKVIGKCQRGRKVPAREKCIEELLCALIHSHYPESLLHSRDRRPISNFYAAILRACSADFLNILLDKQDVPNPLYQKTALLGLLKSHGKLLHQRVVDAVLYNGTKDLNLANYFKAFCYKFPTTPGPFPRISTPMAFSMRMLKLQVDSNNKISWPQHVSESEIYSNLLSRCIKKKIWGDKLRDVLALGLELLAVTDQVNRYAFPSSTVWREILNRWGRSPDQYESLLAKAISLEIGGSSNSTSKNIVTFAKELKLKPDRTWNLLCLYCKNVPKKKNATIGDLETTTYLTSLGKQQWVIELFYMLERDKAIHFLESLQKSFPNDSLLQKTNEISILNDKHTGTQGNVILLLTILRQQPSKVQPNVSVAVDSFRKKSATSREQLQRSSCAMAALQYSIASGNLDLYGETILWLQRFVRDSLTSKEVFGRNAVLTIEGIQLLSGIADPLPDDVTLQTVADTVQKANAILRNLHETMLMAKKEPSFQEYDWHGVFELFVKVIQERAKRMKTIQQRLHASDAEVYTAIWAETLEMLRTINVNFLSQAISPIQEVIFRLPPTTLVRIAKALLAEGAERRKQGHRQPGDDTMETLSYSVLLRVIQGDKPELAQQLVLQTIVDRPDASSWHRQFLSASFLKSLSANQAQEMLLAFATAIGEKLEEQSYVQIESSATATPAIPRTSVKVTTVKYLAQLLDNATFIPTDTAIDVLIELFKAGTHRDVRLATLESLLSLLNTLCNVSDENWRSDPSIEKIMEALASIVPVVGSINERRPLREAEWEEAEATGKLPEVCERSNVPPLMSAIFAACSGYPYVGLHKLRGEFFSRYLLPIYRLSQNEQRRWNAIFLKKHNPGLKVDDLPAAPVVPYLWVMLVRDYTEQIPQAILDDYNQHIITTITPPPNLRAFNASLKTTLDLRSTPEAAQWLSLYDLSMTSFEGSFDASLTSGTRLLIRIIEEGKSTSVAAQGITYERMTEMITTHATLFLSLYETKPNLWSDFTKAIRPPGKSKLNDLSEKEVQGITERWQTYQQYCRPILQKALVLLESRKTRLRQAGARAILPSTDLLKHWLLTYPAILSSKAEKVKQCASFVKDLETNLSHSLDGQSNILRWPRVLQEALTISELLSSEERLIVALQLGKLLQPTDQKSVALNFVKMGIAMELIENGGLLGDRKVGETDWHGLRETIWRWIGHEDEGIRERALEWKKDKWTLWKKIEVGDVVGK